MLNEGSYIEDHLVKIIVLEAYQNEQTRDRAFSFIGLYPITTTTIGPVSWGTSILLVSGFRSIS